MIDHDGSIDGALCLMRSVQQVRLLEGELHNRAVTDPLTGLANRQAFCASLRRHLAGGGGQVVAVFAVDGMRALLMRYGQRTADEVVWGFAQVPRSHGAARSTNSPSSMVNVSACLLPAMSLRIAPRMGRGCGADLRRPCRPLRSAKAPQLTASAGLARVECTVDWDLARGGNWGWCWRVQAVAVKNRDRGGHRRAA